jgi:hypothetical protein
MVFRSRTQSRFAILPPARREVPDVLRNIDSNTPLYDGLLSKMQRLRGRVYGADGAIRRTDLTADGRHKLNVDERSWHVLSLDPSGEVVACLRYLEESRVSSFDSLRVRHAALARCTVQGPRFRRAVEGEMQRARLFSIGFGEVGGWAVEEDRRCTTEALRIVLATYALLELLGSCTGIATATFRHSSAPILRRIGLTALRVDGDEIPPYYDPQYGCLMQILQFDSRSPNPRYRDSIVDIMADLTNAPVICRQNQTAIFERVWRDIKTPRLVPMAAPASIGA